MERAFKMQKETKDILNLILKSLWFGFWFLKELIIFVGKELLLMLFEFIFRVQEDIKGALEFKEIRLYESRCFRHKIKDYWA